MTIRASNVESIKAKKRQKRLEGLPQEHDDETKESLDRKKARVGAARKEIAARAKGEQDKTNAMKQEACTRLYQVRSRYHHLTKHDPVKFLEEHYHQYAAWTAGLSLEVDTTQSPLRQSERVLLSMIRDASWAQMHLQWPLIGVDAARADADRILKVLHEFMQCIDDIERVTVTGSEAQRTLEERYLQKDFLFQGEDLPGLLRL
ncbi:hypothetical protein AAF712_005744 [Marasmius tenuissimus]|uniref:Uncharacterized protein n=1 Tax=Marasmius tenuissimus TaxID=585030 RepID=A0ABR3A1C3_9AGAR